MTKGLGYQWWHRPLKMATTGHERKIGLSAGILRTNLQTSDRAAGKPTAYARMNDPSYLDRDKSLLLINTPLQQIQSGIYIFTGFL